jgi:glycosyltransferase involved in cell wall biosynthesis
VRIKDHITLLKAFSILKKSKKEASQQLMLKIAGDGELKTELITIAEHLGISGDVVFTGMLNEEQLTAFLGSLDIYVHASLGETMSTAIMQAMACGLPIIASDVNGINNMITDKIDGILVPAKNEQLLATALSILINDPLLRKSLAQNAFTNAVNNYSNQTMFQSYKRNIFNS